MRSTRQRSAHVALAAASALLLLASAARADEGGVSFWAPGQFGSFSVVPTAPGWAVPLVYYHVSANAGTSKNFIIGGNPTAGIDATGDLLFFFPTYTFTQPVLGGQAAFGLGSAAGHLRGSAEVAVTGPLGNTVTEKRTQGLLGIRRRTSRLGLEFLAVARVAARHWQAGDIAAREMT